MRKYCIRMICLFLLVFTAANAVCETVPLDMNNIQKGGCTPQTDHYIYSEGKQDPCGYEDPSISVRIEKSRFMDTDYMLVFVRIAQASQLRTALASSYNSTATEFGSTIAKRVSAVLAINGDFYTSRRDTGLVARMGKIYRNKADGRYDVLIIDDMGDMHILPNATAADVESFEGVIYQGLTFGPGLVIDGQRQTGYINNDNAADKAAQRMILCQTGKLKYMVVCIEGPEDPGSKGLTLEEATELLMSIEGVSISNAYNLDGGSSATVVFRNQKSSYAKINSPLNPKVRNLADIIYFASAWQP